MKEAEKPNHPEGAGKEPPAPLKILLADDLPMNLALVEKLLIRRGHTVRTVENGQQALEACKQETFDAVLMDMQMPVMDGIEATRLIRQHESDQGTHPHVPIIAMTANDDENDKQACRKAGMDGFITKPIEIKTIGTTIREIIDNAKKT